MLLDRTSLGMLQVATQVALEQPAVLPKGYTTSDLRS
jgi:hypothetical protein